MKSLLAHVADRGVEMALGFAIVWIAFVLGCWMGLL